MPKGPKMKQILIPVVLGLIVSNFIPYFLDKYPDYRIVNLDKLTYAGPFRELKGDREQLKI